SYHPAALSAVQSTLTEFPVRAIFLFQLVAALKRNSNWRCEMQKTQGKNLYPACRHHLIADSLAHALMHLHFVILLYCSHPSFKSIQPLRIVDENAPLDMGIRYPHTE